MNRSSIFKKKIDFNKSYGSYLFDKDTNEKYLDFFGQYSTLAIGYNHSIFKTKKYLDEVQSVAHQKITNCEILSSESTEFDKKFRDFTSSKIFSHYHYSSTGALAIEAAIKTAIDYKGIGFNRVISFKKSFHGINSYGGFLTDRFQPVIKRLDGFPGQFWKPIENPVIDYKDNKEIIDEKLVNRILSEIEEILDKEQNVCAILVEPVQCTYGDHYFPEIFFKGLRDLATNYDTPLIFDEIQVGFGGTGKLWYFEHLPIVPDILVFGKKTQLSGIAVQSNFAKIFNNAIRLEVTWDADIMDMIRCKYIIEAYKKNNVLNNVNIMSKRIINGLSDIKKLKNLRYCGLLVAFDFEEASQREAFVRESINNRMLCNPTRDKTVRLRPNLLINKEEVDHAISIIKKVVKKI